MIISKRKIFVDQFICRDASYPEGLEGLPYHHIIISYLVANERERRAAEIPD